MKNFIVFEDSSRVNFGGGQKMTLTICDILKNKFIFRFVDFSNSTKFCDIVRKDYPKCKLVNVGHANIKSKYRYLSWLKTIPDVLFHFTGDIGRIMDGVDRNNAISYVTNKRSLIYAFYIYRKYKVPFVYHAHLVENPKGIYYPLFKWMVSKASNILCVSKTVMKSIPLRQSVLLYNPSLNSKGYKGEKTGNKFVVGFVGGLIPIKGVEYFIEAAKQLPEDIEFRIYGDGILRDKLMELSSGRVKFMGFVSDIIAEYYKAIDALVIPTVIEEALPLVAVDAKSVGLPVIVTFPGGQAEIVKDDIDGFYVPTKNATAIADKIMQLYSNSELYKDMSIASYESFADFNFELFQNKILAILK